MTNLLPEWEDGNFYLAKYYDKVMPMVTDHKLEKQGNLIRYIVLYFGKSVFVFTADGQSPENFRILSLTFSFGWIPSQGLAVWKPVHLPGHAPHAVSVVGLWSQSV